MCSPDTVGVCVLLNCVSSEIDSIVFDKLLNVYNFYGLSAFIVTCTCVYG